MAGLNPYTEEGEEVGFGPTTSQLGVKRQDSQGTYRTVYGQSDVDPAPIECPT